MKISFTKQGWKIVIQLYNVWVWLMNAKFLENNMNIFQSNKTNIASSVWKYIFDNRYLLQDI